MIRIVIETNMDFLASLKVTKGQTIVAVMDCYEGNDYNNLDKLRQNYVNTPMRFTTLSLQLWK